MEPVPQNTIDQAFDKIRRLFIGNGVADSDIRLKSFDGGTLDFEAFVTWRVTPDLAEKRMSGPQKGRIIASESQLRLDVRHMMGQTAHDMGFRQAVKEQFQARKNLGFGSDGETVTPQALTQTLVVHQPCTACQGSKGVSCEACYGSGQTPCLKCDGRREMACTACNGTCTVPSNKGRVSCPRCSGSGRTWCTFCKGTGKISCRKCQSSGRILCRNCNGTGVHSLINIVQFTLNSTFTYDRAYVPPDAQAFIDQRLDELQNHAEITFIEDPARIAEIDRQTGASQLTIPYRVRLPFGTMIVSIKNNDVKTSLFGTRGLLLGMPPVLEKMAGRGLKALSKISVLPKHASKMMTTAMRYRLAADMVHAAAMHPSAQALGLLRKKYSFGIRDETLKAGLRNAYRAIAVMTRLAKWSGIAAGFFTAAGLYALCCMGNFKQVILTSLPSTGLDETDIDILVFIAGIVLASVMIQLIAGRALRGIFPKGQKAPCKITSRWRKSVVWGVVEGIVAYCTVLYAAVMTGHAVPPWFASLLRLVSG